MVLTFPGPPNSSFPPPFPHSKKTIPCSLNLPYIFPYPGLGHTMCSVRTDLFSFFPKPYIKPYLLQFIFIHVHFSFSLSLSCPFLKVWFSASVVQYHIVFPFMLLIKICFLFSGYVIMSYLPALL